MRLRAKTDYQQYATLLAKDGVDIGRVAQVQKQKNC